VLPYRPILSNPTLGMILEGVRGRVISTGPDLDRVIESIAIGAMEPHHMLERVGPGTLVIVPGDREDVILTLTTAHLTGPSRSHDVEALIDGTPGAVQAGPGQRAVGMVLTGGYEPRPEVIDTIRKAGLFAAFAPDDTYAVASEIHDLLVKTHASDSGKIELIKELVWDGLQLNPILEAASEAVFA
jgi:phosphate acetyltransferase